MEFLLTFLNKDQKDQPISKRQKILNDRGAKHLYLAGESLQLSMLSTFLAYSSAFAGTFTNTNELIYAAAGFGVLSIYYQWTAGSELKKAAKNIDSN